MAASSSSGTTPARARQRHTKRRGRVTSSTGELPHDAHVQLQAMPSTGIQSMQFTPTMLGNDAELHPVARDGTYEVTIPIATGSFAVRAAAPATPARLDRPIEARLHALAKGLAQAGVARGDRVADVPAVDRPLQHSLDRLGEREVHLGHPRRQHVRGEGVPLLALS